MLYDGALKFMDLGAIAMRKRDLHEQNKNLQKSQAIIAELMSCLDLQQGGEVGNNLFGIYAYVYNELVRSNIEDDVAAVEACSQILAGLRSSWSALEQQLSRAGEPLPHAA